MNTGFPPFQYDDRESRENDSHLSSLSLGFKIVAVIHGLLCQVGWFHFIMGVMLANESLRPSKGGGPPPAVFGYLFAAAGALAVIGGPILAVLMWRAGNFIAERKHWTYCVVLSAIALLFQPLGLVLGILALIVLNKASVRSMFST